MRKVKGEQEAPPRIILGNSLSQYKKYVNI